MLPYLFFFFFYNSHNGSDNITDDIDASTICEVQEEQWKIQDKTKKGDTFITRILRSLMMNKYSRLFLFVLYIGRQLCWKDYLDFHCHTVCMNGCMYMEVAHQQKGKPNIERNV